MYLAVFGEHLDERGADDEAICDLADHLDLLLRGDAEAGGDGHVHGRADGGKALL